MADPSDVPGRPSGPPTAVSSDAAERRIAAIRAAAAAASAVCWTMDAAPLA